MERVLDELIREAGLLENARRGDEVPDAAAFRAADFDKALLRQAAKQQVGEAERYANTFGEFALGSVGGLRHLVQQVHVPIGAQVHGAPTRNNSSIAVQRVNPDAASTEGRCSFAEHY